MASPTLTVRIAFGSAAFAASPSWDDVSTDNMGFTIIRGKQYEMGREEAGTASITLLNSSGNYWKNNTGGAHYPYIVPMRRANLRAAYGGTTYDLFTGFSENWTPSFLMDPVKGPVTNLACADLIKCLSNFYLNNAGYAQELSGARIDNVLDSLAWPATDRALDTGISLVQSTGGAIADLNAQDHLYIVQATEQGIFFIAPDGKPTFHDRHARLNWPYNTSQHTFTDDASHLATYPTSHSGFSKIVLTNDDQYLFNDVIVTRVGGTRQAFTDSDSIFAYGMRSLPLTGQLNTTDTECLSQAQYLVGKYHEPAQRVRQLVFHPESNPDNLWPIALGLDISSRITVELTPASVAEDYHIEGIMHKFIPGQPWETTYDLSPASNQIYWSLGDTGFSELGDTTILCY